MEIFTFWHIQTRQTQFFQKVVYHLVSNARSPPVRKRAFYHYYFCQFVRHLKKASKSNEGPAKLKQINSTSYRRGFDFSVLAVVVLFVMTVIRNGVWDGAVAGMGRADDAAGCRHADDARWGEPEEQDPRMARFPSRIKAERCTLSRCAVLFHWNDS